MMMSGNDCWSKNVFSRWRKVAIDGDDWMVILHKITLLSIIHFGGELIVMSIGTGDVCCAASW